MAMIETTLRDGLAERAATMDVPGDPWPAFAERESRHRRHRRRRVGAVSAALVLLAGLQSGVVPMPGWAPAIAIASQDDALVESPVRGSLAADAGWLDGMRAQIKDVQNPGEVWRVTDRRAVRFLYAGDVGPRRLALAYVPLRFGFVTDPQLIWWEGPAGAAPAGMEQSANVDGGQPYAAVVQGSNDRRGSRWPDGRSPSIRPAWEGPPWIRARRPWWSPTRRTARCSGRRRCRRWTTGAG